MERSRVGSVLSKIAGFVGKAPDDLGVTVAARGGDPYHVLVATLVSLRTRDEIVQKVVPRLLAAAPSPEAMAVLTEQEIGDLVRPANFHRTKARHIRESSLSLIKDHGGKVPADRKKLMSLLGVGPKSANLVLSLGFNKPAICVDIHVHRVSNRLGFVTTSHPEDTETSLDLILPVRWRIPINGVLIAFGRTCCTPVSPKCTTCPVSKACPRIGVGTHR